MKENLLGNLLATLFAVLFWAGVPAYTLIQDGYTTSGILWGVIIGIVVGSVLLAESGVRLPHMLHQFVKWVDKHSIHDCDYCTCGCGSPCQCNHKCQLKNY